MIVLGVKLLLFTRKVVIFTSLPLLESCVYLFLYTDKEDREKDSNQTLPFSLSLSSNTKFTVFESFNTLNYLRELIYKEVNNISGD